MTVVRTDGRSLGRSVTWSPNFLGWVDFLSYEAKCTTFLVKMSFFMRMKNHFHIKGWALNLVLIQRPDRTRKWPINVDKLLSIVWNVIKFTRDCLWANNADIVMATVWFLLDNTEFKFADLSGNQLPINFKLQIGLKITKITNSNIPRTSLGISLCCPIFLPCLPSFKVGSFVYMCHHEMLPLSFQTFFQTGSQIHDYSTSAKSYRPHAGVTFLQ